MDLPDQGAAEIRTGVKEAPCTRKMDDNQLWWVEKRPNTNGLHWIHNYASNQLCLNVAGYADKGEDRADGTEITIFGRQDDGDLEWFIVKPDSQQ